MPRSIDPRPLQRDLARLRKVADNAEREMQRVVSQARRVANTEAKRAIASRYALSQRRIAQDLRTTGNRRALSVDIVAQGRPITARSYAGRQVRAGYRFEVLRGQPVTLRRGFTQSAVTVPLQRLGLARYPIAGIYGPAVPDQLANPAVEAVLDQRIGDRIGADVNRRIQRALEG